MSQTEPVQTTPPPAKPSSRWTRIAQIVAGVAVVVVGGVTLLNLFVLPDCDSSRIQDTVRDIFKSTDAPLTVYSNITSISDENAKKMCGAHIETATEKAEIKYSISWQGWSPYVKIEEVNM